MMAKIEVETLTGNCWNNCDDFEITSAKFIGDGLIYHRIFQCENVYKCRRIQQVIENEMKGGDTE